MVSARTAQLTDQLDVVRREMDLAMKQVPTDYARIAVCEREIDSLTEKLTTGPEKLTLLQVVDSTAQSLMSARLTSASPSMPSLHLRHVPDQVLPWPDVEKACAFRESLPATPALYDGYVPAAQRFDGKEVFLLLLDMTLFSVVNQLENVPDLAAMKVNEHPFAFDLPGKCVN
ncbi:TPA: hypothetical protein ACH3X3_009708 [Trebouxia sp. C0006]